MFATTVGTPLSPDNVRARVLRPVAEEAGVSWCGLHTIRHTCATRLFAEGRNAVQVQRWLGHHSPAFTPARYVHLLGNDLGGPLELGGATYLQPAQSPLDAARRALSDTDLAS